MNQVPNQTSTSSLSSNSLIRGLYTSNLTRQRFVEMLEEDTNTMVSFVLQVDRGVQAEFFGHLLVDRAQCELHVSRFEQMVDMLFGFGEALLIAGFNRFLDGFGDGCFKVHFKVRLFPDEAVVKLPGRSSEVIGTAKLMSLKALHFDMEKLKKG